MEIQSVSLIYRDALIFKYLTKKKKKITYKTHCYKFVKFFSVEQLNKFNFIYYLTTCVSYVTVIKINRGFLKTLIEANAVRSCKNQHLNPTVAVL